MRTSINPIQNKVFIFKLTVTKNLRAVEKLKKLCQQTDKQTKRQTDKQTNRQTNKQKQTIGIISADEVLSYFPEEKPLE